MEGWKDGRRGFEPSIRIRSRMFRDIHSCAGPFLGPRNKCKNIFILQSGTYTLGAVPSRPTNKNNGLRWIVSTKTAVRKSVRKHL
jgi:hypothetical protein